jgi:hypothetical protein
MSKNANYIYPILVMSNDINTGEGVNKVHFPLGGKRKGVN